MPVDPGLADLVKRVGSFHITHRAMKRAQAAVETAIEKGEIDDATRSAYLDEVRRYFESFDREARDHLRDVDRRLERANQVHFNLTAERGVAVKRIEATSSILETLATVERSVP
jgi:flavin-dependent dehydrogenase